jgi:Mn2+/Fe2+ NRAMP family transporter
VFQSPLFRNLGRWFGLLGLVSAAGILAGTLEFAGIALAADVVTVAYILWSVWLLALGVTLLLRRAEWSGTLQTPDPASRAHS